MEEKPFGYNSNNRYGNRLVIWKWDRICSNRSSLLAASLENGDWVTRKRFTLRG